MNKEILIAMGFEDEVRLIEEGKCPFCRKVIDINSFRSELNYKEFTISGLCQECQDEFFGTALTVIKGGEL